MPIDTFPGPKRLGFSRRQIARLSGLAIFPAGGMNGLTGDVFTIRWDEELLLSDGSIYTVKFERDLKRRGFFGPSALSRVRTRLILQPEAGTENVVLQTRLWIGAVDRVKGTWYVVLNGLGPSGINEDDTPGKWGNDFTTNMQRLARLEGGAFRPVHWNEISNDVLTQSNVLSNFVSQGDLPTYDNKLFSMTDGIEIRKDYPSTTFSITRPQNKTTVKKTYPAPN